MISYAIISSQNITLRWITDKCCQFCLETVEPKQDWSHVFYERTCAVNMSMVEGAGLEMQTSSAALPGSTEDILAQCVAGPRYYLCVACVCQWMSIHNSRMRKGRGLPLLSPQGMFLLLPQNITPKNCLSCTYTRITACVATFVLKKQTNNTNYKGYNIHDK